MKLEEIGYRFENAGQYRVIMKTLGYSEEYSNGYIKFTSPDQTTQRSNEEIKNVAKNMVISDESYTKSLKYICGFFDMEKAKNDLASYNEFLKENYNIYIHKWENIKVNQNLNKNQSLDGYSIIDNKNKISYTGLRLYNYAIENSISLDGKGTIAENDLTELYNFSASKKKPRLRSTNKNDSLKLEYDRIIIPDSIYGNILKDWQKIALEAGEIVLIQRSKKSPIYLQIDHKNNTIIVRTDKQINLEKLKSIEGHTFNDFEKTLLLNNKFTIPILFKDKGKFYYSNIKMTDDLMGIEFHNAIEISKEKAKELKAMDIKNSQEIFVYTNGMTIEQDKQKELEIELLKGIYNNTDNGSLTIVLENAKNRISTNLPNFYAKYDLSDLGNKNIVDLKNVKDKIKSHLLELDPEFINKPEIKEDIESFKNIIKDIEKNPYESQIEIERALRQEKELTSLFLKYGQTSELEKLGVALLELDSETLINLGLDKRLNESSYIKENPLNISKIDTALYAVLGEIEIEKLKQNIKDLKFEFAEISNDDTIRNKEELINKISNNIDSSKERIDIIETSLSNYYQQAKGHQEEIKIQITPFIYETYQLLPDEIQDLKDGKAIFAMGEDPVDGREYESSLKMNPKTGFIQENRNADVQQWMRNDWFDRHRNFNHSVTNEISFEKPKDLPIEWKEDLIKFDNYKNLDNDELSSLIYKYKEFPSVTEAQIDLAIKNKLSGEYLSNSHVLSAFMETDFVKENNITKSLTGVTTENAKPIHLLISKTEISELTESLSSNYEVLNEIKSGRSEITGYHDEDGGLGGDQKEIDQIKYTEKIVELENSLTPTIKLNEELEEKFKDHSYTHQLENSKESNLTTNRLTVQEEKVINAIMSNDYVELNKIAESNFTLSPALRKEIEGLNLSEDKKVGVLALLGYNTDLKVQTDKDKKKDPVKTNIKDQSLKAIDGLFR